MEKIYYCPSCDITCPYCVGLNYECVIGDPANECDDYAFYTTFEDDEVEEEDE